MKLRTPITPAAMFRCLPVHGCHVFLHTGIMLAYVFWHWPRPSVSAQDYETRLHAFHQALRLDPPDRFLESAWFRISGASWLPKGGYEDWYEIADFAALGILNDAAVSGSRKAPHDAVAALADGGAGGLYRLVAGEARWRECETAVWFRKPTGMTYEALQAEMGRFAGSAALWQRQLVLGPTPEFCLQGSVSLKLAEKYQHEEVRLGRTIHT